MDEIRRNLERQLAKDPSNIEILRQLAIWKIRNGELDLLVSDCPEPEFSKILVIANNKETDLQTKEVALLALIQIGWQLFNISNTEYAWILPHIVAWKEKAGLRNFDRELKMLQMWWQESPNDIDLERDYRYLLQISGKWANGPDLNLVLPKRALSRPSKTDLLQILETLQRGDNVKMIAETDPSKIIEFISIDLRRIYVQGTKIFANNFNEFVEILRQEGFQRSPTQINADLDWKLGSSVSRENWDDSQFPIFWRIERQISLPHRIESIINFLTNFIPEFEKRWRRAIQDFKKFTY